MNLDGSPTNELPRTFCFQQRPQATSIKGGGSQLKNVNEQNPVCYSQLQQRQPAAGGACGQLRCGDSTLVRYE